MFSACGSDHCRCQAVGSRHCGAAWDTHTTTPRHSELRSSPAGSLASSRNDLLTIHASPWINTPAKQVTHDDSDGSAHRR
jgi:hypothetical protein